MPPNTYSFPSRSSRLQPRTSSNACKSLPSSLGISFASFHREIVFTWCALPVNELTCSATSLLVKFLWNINSLRCHSIATVVHSKLVYLINAPNKYHTALLVWIHHFECIMKEHTNQKPLVPWKVLSGLRPNRRQLMIVAESFVSTKIHQYWFDYTSQSLNSAKALNAIALTKSEVVA